MSFAGDIFAALLPPKCTLCGSVADGHKVIPDIVPAGANICCRCASSFVPSVPDRRWFLCLSEPYEGDPHPELKLYMPYEYDGRMASMIHKIKFGKQRELAFFAGGLLGMIMKEDHITPDSYDLIVPIPLSYRRLKERGFNQAESIGKAVAGKVGIPMAGDVLVRTRHTERQAELEYGEQRAGNVRGAFDMDKHWDIGGLSILLIDDVATTGHTLHEASEALYEGGAGRVVCVALCGNRMVKNVEPY